MHADFYMNWSFFLRPKGSQFDNAEGLSSVRYRDIGRCYSTANSAFDCSTNVTSFATTRRNGTASSVVPHGARTTFGLLRCATRPIGARPGRSPPVLRMRISPMRDLTLTAVACHFKGSDET